MGAEAGAYRQLKPTDGGATQVLQQLASTEASKRAKEVEVEENRKIAQAKAQAEEKKEYNKRTNTLVDKAKEAEFKGVTFEDQTPQQIATKYAREISNRYDGFLKLASEQTDPSKRDSYLDQAKTLLNTFNSYSEIEQNMSNSITKFHTAAKAGEVHRFSNDYLHKMETLKNGTYSLKIGDDNTPYIVREDSKGNIIKESFTDSLEGDQFMYDPKNSENTLKLISQYAPKDSQDFDGNGNIVGFKGWNEANNEMAKKTILNYLKASPKDRMSEGLFVAGLQEDEENPKMEGFTDDEYEAVVDHYFNRAVAGVETANTLKESKKSGGSGGFGESVVDSYTEAYRNEDNTLKTPLELVNQRYVEKGEFASNGNLHFYNPKTKKVETVNLNRSKIATRLVNDTTGSLKDKSALYGQFINNKGFNEWVKGLQDASKEVLDISPLVSLINSAKTQLNLGSGDKGRVPKALLGTLNEMGLTMTYDGDDDGSYTLSKIDGEGEALNYAGAPNMINSDDNVQTLDPEELFKFLMTGITKMTQQQEGEEGQGQEQQQGQGQGGQQQGQGQGQQEQGGAVDGVVNSDTDTTATDEVTTKNVGNLSDEDLDAGLRALMGKTPPQGGVKKKWN